jgi:hypothetical protein
VEHLDGHKFPAQIVVVREVDLAETTLPQQLHKLVAPVQNCPYSHHQGRSLPLPATDGYHLPEEFGGVILY